MSVIDLGLARVERETDNGKITVEELLRLALKDVLSGEVRNPQHAILIITGEGDGENPPWVIQGYRCRLTRHEEIGILDLFKSMQIRKWMDLNNE